MRGKVRKIVAGVLMAAAVLVVGTTSVFASNTKNIRSSAYAGGNNICDYKGTFCHYIDEDNDGICDYYGTRQGKKFCGGQNRQQVTIQCGVNKR